MCTQHATFIISILRFSLFTMVLNRNASRKAHWKATDMFLIPNITIKNEEFYNEFIEYFV